jgi:IclR family acetate operon transcriptional repressor
MWPISVTCTNSPDGTVARVAIVLGALAEASQPLGVKQISEATGLPMSTTHRLLDLLSECGFVQKIANIHKYDFGNELLRIAATAIYKNPLSRVLQPILNEVTARTNETSAFVLYHPERGDISYHAKADSRQYLRFRLSVNARADITSNAFGYAVRASLPYQVADGAVPDAAILGDAAAAGGLHAYLEHVRQEGYAVSADKEPSGIAHIAAPVKSKGDNVLGAIGLVVPVVRFDQKEAAAYGALVTEAAKKLGSLL